MSDLVEQGDELATADHRDSATRLARLGRGLVRALEPPEQAAVGEWAKALLELRSSGISRKEKAREAIAATYRSRVPLTVAKVIVRRAADLVWTDRSWAFRMAAAAATATVTIAKGKGAGIAALGTAVGVPLWVVFGAGAALAGASVDEVEAAFGGEAKPSGPGQATTGQEDIPEADYEIIPRDEIEAAANELPGDAATTIPVGFPIEPQTLTEDFDDALRLAHEFHRTDVRKGAGVPYLSHLIQVAGLVLEADGDEEQAIAALFHDALEDAATTAEAAAREDRIRQQFGDRVADIVLGCTDGDPAEKEEMNWKDRKRRHLRHLQEQARDDVLLVSVADKLHNARSILRDYGSQGEAVWRRFRGGKGGTLWYYRELIKTYRSQGVGEYVDELDEVVSTLESEAVRGSRQHILNWLEDPDFLEQLNEMIRPSGAAVSRADIWRPLGWRDPAEAKLDREFAQATGDLFDAEALERWWLAHPRGANVPNWDLAATCQIRGARGLVLVEAKAHVGELDHAGKKEPGPEDSENSHRNHEKIRGAIATARDALQAPVPGIAISIDHAYQFSNRVAHAWWLAQYGVPVVLLYLGFLADSDMPQPFESAEAWEECLHDHTGQSFPRSAFDTWIEAGATGFTVTSASLPAPEDRRPRMRSLPKVR